MLENDARKREGAQLLLRFAEGSDLRETLKRIAALNGRTLTAEILFRLEKSVEEEGKSIAANVGISEELDRRLRTEKWEMQEAIRKLQSEIDEIRGAIA